MAKPETSARHRQAILDHLNQHGPSNVRQLLTSVDLQKSAISRYLNGMIGAKEVRVETRLDYRAATHYYTALVASTARQILPGHDSYTSHPWRTIHKGTAGAHPIPNQGGQGKCPPRKHTSLGYNK